MVPQNIQKQITDFVLGDITAEEFAIFLEAHPAAVGELIETEVYPYFHDAYGVEVEDLEVDSVKIDHISYDENAKFVYISGSLVGVIESMTAVTETVGVEMNFDIDVFAPPPIFDSLKFTGYPPRDRIDLEVSKIQK